MVNGQIYRSGDGTLKMILNGLYASNEIAVTYLAQTDTEITSIMDEILDN